ncbi:MAG: thiamine pyrophosphate-binding protein [Synergistaceae bacterium]|jgi:acetolactate synthase-1/2/3 large subunit|nr:thiamine pyrophosphate-binding protein [Synergistaceae bacterium]
MSTIAEQFIRTLGEIGVRHIYGIPGGPSIPYMEALRKNGMRFILTSNEQSAGVMADVSARLLGIPGVCHSTFGPGATNLATGVGGALLDRSPVLALTTEVSEEDTGRKIQMNIDHQALFAPISKWTARLNKNWRETLNRALSIACTELKGPVHIGLPVGVDAHSADPRSSSLDISPAPLPKPDPKLLARAGELIIKARKPLLALGLTSLRLGLAPGVRAFADHFQIPVVVTPMAKGVIPESHPCFAGVLFHARSDIVAEVYRNADLVIGLGYDSVEFNYETWMPDVPLIHIDSERADIASGYDVACDISGDVGKALEYINTLVPSENEWGDAVAVCRTALWRALTPQEPGFTPSSLIIALQDAMPADYLLTADVGAHLHLLGQLWQANEPGRFLITNGWSSMGFGIPAAIAAKLCRPHTAVVCLIGDGGFLMTCGELVTARRLGLNVVFIVLCDRSLSLIGVKQERHGVQRYATSLYEGAFFGADSFLGVPVLHANRPEDVEPALAKAFRESGPVIIEASVDGTSFSDLVTKKYT